MCGAGSRVTRGAQAQSTSGTARDKGRRERARLWTQISHRAGWGGTVTGTSTWGRQSSFNERFTAVHCDERTLFVFTSCDSLLFLVVTDEGDSVPFLKRQLQLVYELLQFKLGPKPDVRAALGRGPARTTLKPPALTVRRAAQCWRPCCGRRCLPSSASINAARVCANRTRCGR